MFYIVKTTSQTSTDSTANYVLTTGMWSETETPNTFVVTSYSPQEFEEQMEADPWVVSYSEITASSLF